jgi:4-hydroxy-4-methyl-2-oxoglutarate aldolase
MRRVIVTGPPRADAGDVEALTGFGVSTVHEALGQDGYLGPDLRPIQDGARIGGTAVTVLRRPGDNLMIHAAVEQCQPGDILVVTTTSPSRDGSFGELLATALQHRGVRGVVTTAGVRDVADLRAMGFPAWSGSVSAQGTVKANAGAVNVPIGIGGRIIHPGDVVLADDDGVLCVPRNVTADTLRAARAREAKEEATREAFRGGELGLDRYGLRQTLEDLGVEYLTAEEYGRLR